MRQYYRTTNSELYHHGIKGQKWGVRRYQNKDGSLTSSGRKRNMSEDHKVAHDLKKRKLSSLSNKELKTVNERMNLEANYKDLKNNRNASIGKKFVEKAIVGAAVAGVTIAVGNRIRKGTQGATDKVIDTAIELGKKYMKHSETDEVDDFLMHHGVKGQKWGVRRYQNKDGTLTAAGKSHLKDDNKSKKNTKELKKFGRYTEASTNPKDWLIDVDNIQDKMTSKDYDNMLTAVKAHNSSLKGQAYADSVIDSAYASNKPLTQRQISKIEAYEESRYNTMRAIDKLSSIGAGRVSGEHHSEYSFTDYDKEFEYYVHINDNGKVKVTGYNWDDDDEY